MLEDKFCDQSLIKISVLTYEGKKLTKSMFEQLETLCPFRSDFSFTGDKIFGYINVKNESKKGLNKILVFEKAGKLHRFNTINLEIIRNFTFNTGFKTLQEYVDLEDLFQENLSEVLNYDYEKINYEKINVIFNDYGKSKLVEVFANVEVFMTLLNQHQILL